MGEAIRTPMVREDDWPDRDTGKEGAFAIRRCIEGALEYDHLIVLILVKGVMETHGLPLYRGTQDKDRLKIGRASWWWNGDREKPSLKPSLAIRGRNERGEEVKPDRWHGYITDGFLVADNPPQ